MEEEEDEDEEDEELKPLKAVYGLDEVGNQIQ